MWRWIILTGSGGIFDKIKESETAGGQISYYTERTEFSEFEKQIMTGNRCRALLNMRCVFNSGGTRIYYAADNCVRLDDILRSGMADAYDVLSICSAFLETLNLCSDHLLAPSDIPFDRDENIFCQHRASGVRFAYIPGYVNEMGVREKLVDIADTAIEYCLADDSNIRMLSDYKGRLYSVSDEMRPLMLLTEESARKCSEICAVRGGEKTAARVPTAESEQAKAADSTALEALKEEAGIYKARAGAGIRTKLRTLIDGLVS